MEPVVTTVGDMDDANPFPNDLTQCHQLLLAAYRQSVELERQAAEATQQVAEAEQQVAASQQQVAELNRVLDATADSHAKLQQELAAKLEELAWYKRWVHGRRRERTVVDAEGQQYLFDLFPADTEVPAPPEESRQEVAGHTRRRRRRELDFSHLPHHRHELDLSAEEKICSCCGVRKIALAKT